MPQQRETRYLVYPFSSGAEPARWPVMVGSRSYYGSIGAPWLDRSIAKDVGGQSYFGAPQTRFAERFF